MKYRKKPIVIEAVQWDGADIKPILLLAQERAGDIEQSFTDDYLIINTLEGKMKASKEDFIIRGIRGELYPCKPDIFHQTYDAVKENATI